MDRRRYDSVRLAALSITVLGTLAVGLAGCGGGSDSSPNTAAEAAPGESTTGGGNPGVQRGEADKRAALSQEGHRPSHPFRGGEKDIEEFGSEAGSSESAAVLAAEQGYLTAVVHRDYGKACSLVSNDLERQFQELVRAGRSGQNPTCRQILPQILAPNASHVAALQLSGKVVKVRVEGDRGFVVFHAPGARLFVYPMTKKTGRWHVETITSSILAPSAATLGEE